MKILLHIYIYPSKDGIHCGECRLGKGKNYCPISGKEFKGSGNPGWRKRFSMCLKAEAEAREKKVDTVFAHRRKAKSLLGVPLRIPKEKT